MKRPVIMTGIISVIISMNLASCSQPGSDATGTISFIHLNDLHAHLTPHTDYVKQGNDWTLASAGGLARLATMIKSIRDDNPDSVLMNIGDTFHGGVEALFTKGNAIADPVNALGIDIGVPGNWDFAYGPDVTRLRYTDNLDGIAQQDIEKPAFPNLAANVTYTEPPPKAGEYFLPPTQTMTINHIKIGFIGLTSDIVPLMHPSLAAGLSFLQDEADYLSLLNNFSQQLRDQGANIVVVMSELGIHKDWKLARQLAANTVDIFFSAHTHEATFDPLVTDNNIWVMEAGSDIYLGRLDARFEQGKLVERHWQLLTADSSVAEDETIKNLVAEARAPFLDPAVNMSVDYGGVVQTLTQPIDTVIGNVENGFDRRNALNNIFNKTFAATLKNATGTELALTPGFRYDAVIADSHDYYEDASIVAGQFTLEDAYRFFPVAFTLSTGNVTGERLAQIIEQNLTAVFSPDIFKQAGGWLDGYAGIDISLDLAAEDGQRILGITRHDNGQLVMPGDVFSVTGCTRPFDDPDVLCSYSGFTDIAPYINPETGDAWTAIDFLVNSISTQQQNGLRLTNIDDSSATPQWPASDFYQPLEGVQ